MAAEPRVPNIKQDTPVPGRNESLQKPRIIANEPSASLKVALQRSAKQVASTT